MTPAIKLAAHIGMECWAEPADRSLDDLLRELMDNKTPILEVDRPNNRVKIGQVVEEQRVLEFRLRETVKHNLELQEKLKEAEEEIENLKDQILELHDQERRSNDAD